MKAAIKTFLVFGFILTSIIGFFIYPDISIDIIKSFVVGLIVMICAAGLIESIYYTYKHFNK